MTTGIETLKTRDLKPRIGTEVLADKAALLSGQHAGALRELLEQRGVLVFPRIGLSDDEQIAFTQTLVPSRPNARAKSSTASPWTPPSTPRPTTSRDRCTGISTAP